MSYRSLTKGEIDLARQIFKDSIDYQKVRVYDSRVFPGFIQKKGRAMADLNKISFPDVSASADFSAETDPHRKSVFIHELMHVWQHQNKIVKTRLEYFRQMLKTKFNYSSCYFYTLQKGKDLTSYNYEQQAGIVQDYFALKFLGEGSSYKNRRLNGVGGAGLVALYEDVLAKFLTNPLYASKSVKRRGPKSGS